MSLNNSGNRVVIITGLSQGIGQSIAKDFATSGFNVLVNSSDEQELKNIVANIPTDFCFGKNIAKDVCLCEIECR